MTGAWRGGLATTNATDIGAVTGTSGGTIMNGAATAYTKSAWTQLTASTTTDVSWVLVEVETLTSGGQYFAVDLGVGASGFEVAIVNNLVFSAPGSFSNVYHLPLSIPAGTRVSARFSSSNGYDTLPINLLGFQDTYPSASTGSAVDTYGFSATTNIGAAVDPGGTINTKGAYTQITASTTADICGIVINYDAQTTTTGTGTIPQWLVDVAIGASGSEVVVIPNKWMVSYAAGTASLYLAVSHYMPIPIPAATRIAVRAQCSVNATPDRIFGVTIYGVRQ